MLLVGAMAMLGMPGLSPLEYLCFAMLCFAMRSDVLCAYVRSTHIRACTLHTYMMSRVTLVVTTSTFGWSTAAASCGFGYTQRCLMALSEGGGGGAAAAAVNDGV